MCTKYATLFLLNPYKAVDLNTHAHTGLTPTRLGTHIWLWVGGLQLLLITVHMEC